MTSRPTVIKIQSYSDGDCILTLSWTARKLRNWFRLTHHMADAVGSGTVWHWRLSGRFINCYELTDILSAAWNRHKWENW